MYLRISRLTLVALLGVSFAVTSFAEEASEAPGTPAWRQKVDQSLDKIEVELNELDTKSQKMSQKTRAEWDKTIADLRKHRDKLKADLKNEKSDAKVKAQDYWSRFKSALGELEQGVAKATKKIKGEKE